MSDVGVRRITWRTADVVRVLTLGLLFLFIWKFFWMVHNAIFLALLAVLLAIVIHAPARFLSRWIPFRLAFAFTVFLFICGFVWMLVTIVPRLAHQVGEMAAQIPGVLTSGIAWVETRTGLPPGGDLSRQMNEQVAQFAGRFVPIAYNIITGALGSVAIIVLAIFFAAEPAGYRDLLLRCFPYERREKMAEVYDEAGKNLRAWVIGKALTMVLIGVVTWIGLTLFGIPGALALAVLAALMEFVPNFGPTIAAIPAMLAAFAISPMLAAYVGAFYFLLQQVQNAITVPLVERRAVNIPPAVLLSWQLMLAIGFGILGLFVATPLLAMLLVTVRIFYVEPSEEIHRWDRRDSGNTDTTADVEATPLPPA